MAGKQTYEKTRTNKAYAEGRTARATGAASATNPWSAAFSEENLAWADGYSAVDGTTDDTAYSGVTGLPAATMMGGVDPVTHWPEGALTHLLDTLHISYSHNATRDQLVALVPDTHHPQIAEDVPSATWTVDKIKQWLDARQVSYAGVTGKDNLLYVVHQTIALEAVGVQPNEAADALPPLDESL